MLAPEVFNRHREGLTMVDITEWEPFFASPRPVAPSEWTGHLPAAPSAPSALTMGGPDPAQAVQGLMDAAASVATYGAQAVEAVQTVERSGLLGLFVRAVTGSWRNRGVAASASAAAATAVAGLLAHSGDGSAPPPGPSGSL